MKVNVIFLKQSGSIIGRASNTEELDAIPRIGERRQELLQEKGWLP